MKTIERYAYKNTTSAAGSPKKYIINPSEISAIKKWHNFYGNPSYVYHMENGDTYFLQDDYGAMNDLGVLHFDYVKRKKDLFNRFAKG